MKKGFGKTTLDTVARNIEDLALITAKGFDTMGKKFDNIDIKIDKLEKGQEEIKLRLDNVAYRFELVELQKRVEKLEAKARFH